MDARSYLEEELARRYRESAPATLSLLQERCEAVASELVAAETALSAAEDVAALRRCAMTHVAAVSSRVAALLDGAGDCDPEQHGQTTDEERASSRSSAVGASILSAPPCPEPLLWVLTAASCRLAVARGQRPGAAGQRGPQAVRRRGL